MRRRRLPLGLIVPAALVVLVGALAALQYHWLGQVSEAERAQLQTSLKHRASEFAADFDREISALYQALQIDAAELQHKPGDGFGRHFDQWRQDARFPDLVSALYFARDRRGTTELLAYSPADRSFQPATWPEALEPVRARLLPAVDVQTASGAPVPQMLAIGASPVMTDVPALLIPVPQADAARSAAQAAGAELVRGSVADLPRLLVSLHLGRSALIAHLDGTVLRQALLPAMTDRHFPDSDRYRVAVVDGRQAAVLTRGLSEGRVLAADEADVTMPFFGLKFESKNRTGMMGRVVTMDLSGDVTAMSRPPAAGRDVVTDQFAFVVEHGPAAPAGRTEAQTAFISQSGWQLRLQHADGSLDAAVANVRRRNLWLSFGILALLGASVGLMVLNARRSERLAARQMDFVAAVSHELRTPLAVIRSAAQNLSAGVVLDATQARRYGDLIDTEGRRLTDMVEQVLEYAGLSGHRRPVRARPVDPGAVVREALAGCATQLDAENFEVETRIDPETPAISADEDAVRRAVQNLVTNAVKHAAEGRWVGVSVRPVRVRGRVEVEIAVGDRGRGIEATDLPHLAEPFYRGRQAIDRQIHGNGLGLSLVKRIAEAHGGRLTIASTPGAGATFTIHLPAAEPDPAGEAVGDRLAASSPDAGGHAAS